MTPQNSLAAFCTSPNILVISLTLLSALHPTLGWRDTTPNPNTVTPGFRFLWTHRNGDDVFCDMIVHPGADNRVLVLDDKRFAIQLRLPEKYDHNCEFLKYVSNLLWLKPAEIQITRGKTKFYKRLQFLNPGAGVDINYYRAIFTRILDEHMSKDRIFQKDETPHITFPVSSTKQLYGILGPTPRPIHQKNPRIAMLVGPNYFPEGIMVGVQDTEERMGTKPPSTKKVRKSKAFANA